jgi:hypothetical protein
MPIFFLKYVCLSLYYACAKMRHYLLSSTCVVACQADVIKHMLYRPILTGRVGKWAYTLTEYDLTFEPLKALKGHVIANFIVEHGIDLGYEINYLFVTHGGLFRVFGLQRRPRCWCNHCFSQWCYLRYQADLNYTCTNIQTECEVFYLAREYCTPCR